MLNLRQYQLDAINAVENEFRDTHRTYIEMPTGSGKTVTFLSYAKKNHNKIIVIVPSIQLMNQVYECALKFYDKKEISRKGASFNQAIKTLHICVAMSLKGDYLEFVTQHHFDLIIIDEAHHSLCDSYKRFIKKFSLNYSDPKILGVTATPDRTDGKFLKDILWNTCFKINIDELITQGFLCDLEGFSVKTNISISDIPSSKGDFSLNKLYNKLNSDSRNNLIIDIYKNNMLDKKCLIFCINVKHSQEISKLLKLEGISSGHIDGKMNSNQRKSILDSFRNGEIKVLCNCQLLTEGFDEPAIDGIILARPTRSRPLFTQMVGRGLRIFPNKKNCKIIDIVDNHKHLAGFNCLQNETINYPQIEKFKSLKDIKNFIEEEKLKVTEYEISKVGNFLLKKCDDFEATDSIISYLEKNKIQFFYPISFDEGSFLVWFNELKKEYNNGKHRN